jgi:hypothetical protein
MPRFLHGDYPSLIDVSSFADHHILNVFANNADGLNFSTFYHKDRGGLVQMGPIWDFDRSMACDIDARASNPEVWSLATNPLFFFHSTGPLWFRSLAFNSPDFWVVWVDRWQAMRDGPLSDAAMAGRIERHRAEIAAAALRNYARWSGVLSADEWSGKVDVMKNHVLTRAQWIDDQLVAPPVFNHGGGLVPDRIRAGNQRPGDEILHLGRQRSAGLRRCPGGNGLRFADHHHRQHARQGARMEWAGVCQRAGHMAMERPHRSDVRGRSRAAGDHRDHVSSAPA